MTTPQPLDDDYADNIFTELAKLEVGLDADPLVFGPKRLNGKIALSRKMTARCERLFLDASQKLSAHKRNQRSVDLLLELSKKHLLANDPEVRAGRAVSERDAIATGKLKGEVQEVADARHAVEDLEAVLLVIKAKRSDLRDVQGRLRDQIRLCQEEIGLGGRWGSKSPRGTELEPGQGFANGADADDVDQLIQEVSAAADSETHLKAEVDDSDPEEEQEADLAAPAADAEEADEGAGRYGHTRTRHGDEPVTYVHSTTDPEDEPVPEPVPEPEPEPEPEIIPGEDLVEEFGFVPHCAGCGEVQHRVAGSGMCCPNGHGGCDSVDPAATSELTPAEGDDEPAAVDVLPGTVADGDVAEFLSDAAPEAEETLTRRQVEEDDGFDIESILENWGD